MSRSALCNPLSLKARVSTSAASALVSFGLVCGLLELSSTRVGPQSDESFPPLQELADEAFDNERGRSEQRASPEQIEGALAERRSLRRMFFDDQEQWLDTLVHLDDPAFAADDRLRCAARHGRSISTCFYRVTMVISPIKAGVGEIVHAEATLIDPQLSPSPNSENHPACDAFTNCVAETRISERVPIPEDEKHVFALEQLYQSNQANPMLFRPNKVAEAISAIDETIDMMAEDENPNARDVWRRRKLQNTSSYLREHLRRLEERLQDASKSND